jgi:uncharacterized membrane protein
MKFISYIISVCSLGISRALELEVRTLTIAHIASYYSARMLASITLVLTVFVACVAVVAGQAYMTIDFYNLGTKCTVKANMRSSYGATGYCTPFTNQTETCQTKTTCGAMYMCNATTVTISYWFSAGTECTRNAPDLVSYFPTETCLPPTNAYYNNNTDSMFHCN